MEGDGGLENRGAGALGRRSFLGPRGAWGKELVGRRNKLLLPKTLTHFRGGGGGGVLYAGKAGLDMRDPAAQLMHIHT